MFFLCVFYFIQALKYNASVTKEKTILLFVAGLVLTTFVIVGAILFVPGKTYSYYEEIRADKFENIVGGGAAITNNHKLCVIKQ